MHLCPTDIRVHRGEASIPPGAEKTPVCEEPVEPAPGKVVQRESSRVCGGVMAKLAFLRVWIQAQSRVWGAVGWGGGQRSSETGENHWESVSGC